MNKWDSAPAFYWIQGLKSRDIKETLLEAIRRRPTGADTKQMLVVAAFLGEAYYKIALKAFGAYRDRLAPVMKSFSCQGPRVAFGVFAKSKNQTLAQLRAEKLKELNAIAQKSVENEKEPGAGKRWSAQAIDCFLYAEDDRYK